MLPDKQGKAAGSRVRPTASGIESPMKQKIIIDFIASRLATLTRLYEVLRADAFVGFYAADGFGEDACA